MTARFPRIFVATALLSTHAMASNILISGNSEPIPATAQWEKACQAADKQAGQLADLLLQHLANHGWPVLSVETEISPEGNLEMKLQEGTLQNVTLTGGTPQQRRVASVLWLRQAKKPTIRTADLTHLLEWYHRNPHHAMLPKFEPSQEVNGADVLVDLTSTSKPWGVSAGWANDGVEPLAHDRYWCLLEESDWLGLPHWLGLRTQVGDDPSAYWGFSSQLRCFLPWQHELSLQGLWNQAQVYHDGEDVAAGTWQAGFRYLIPQSMGSGWKFEPGLGLDFRRTNNTFSVGGDSLGHQADSFHIVGEASLFRDSGDTQSGLKIEAGISPGGFTGRNNDKAFATLRNGATSQFWFSRASAWYRQGWGDWTLSLRGTAQYVSDPVLPHDQLPVGGSAGVRGYAEASGLADRGGWASLEMGGPIWRRNFGKNRFGVQPLAFVDAGWAQDVASKHTETLSSTGIGMRLLVGRQWSLSADHAWKIKEPGTRFHLSATLRF